MAILLVVIVAFVVGVGLVLAGAHFAGRVPGMMMQRKLDARLQEIAVGDTAESAPTKALLKKLG